MSFDKPTRNLLAKTVAACRERLAVDIADQLQSAYGLYPDGTQLDVARTEAERRAAQDLRALLAHYESNLPQGKDRPQMAYQRLVREAGFTLLNRLAALRLCEERGLVIECVRQGMESDGFRLYDMLAGGALGNRHQTYRTFLERLFDELARDLGALFDRSNPLSHLFPSEAALSGVLDLLNDPELARHRLWSQDETIGWMYQYYNDPAERKKMREGSQAPRNSRELAVRNQFFTPRYVVEFLADNTLGRLWVEMRGGESRLTEVCRYLVVSNQLSVNSEQVTGGDDSTGNAPQRNPNPKSKIQNRKLKDPRDLKILDPACGSGHFLLYVFDLLLKIYEEAWGDADLPPFSESGTWLARDYPSLDDLRRAAPELIVRHNLHGVDIDPRAAQIAALALWLRAQRAWQELGVPAGERPQVTRTNVVVAEPMPGDARMLDEFIAGLDDVPFIGQLVRVVFEKMKLAGEAGSLLKVEVDLREAIAAAKKQWLARPEPEQLGLWAEAARPRQEQMHFDLSGISDEQFWLEAEGRALAALNEYARQAENGQGARRRLFAQEAGMGFAFVDLCLKQFDVVLMNPPFGEASKESNSYIETTYPSSKHDVYAAFIERFLDSLLPEGVLGAITSRTGFYLSSFQNWRENILLAKAPPIVFADLGFGVLDAALVETAAYVLRKKSDEKLNPTSSFFFRLLQNENKNDTLTEILASLKNGQHHQNAFIASISSFHQVPGKSFAYWVSDRVRNLFQELPPFQTVDRQVKQGLATADDFRFLRLWWEVPALEMVRPLQGSTQEDFRNESVRGKQWAFFAKGGAVSQYYADLYLVLNWKYDGYEIKNFINPETGKPYSRPQNTNYYFRQGLTWPKLPKGRGAFSGVSRGAVFSHAGMMIFLPEKDLWAICALLNSDAYIGLLHLLMPRGVGETNATLKYEVGYVVSVPIPTYDDAISERLSSLALSSFELKRSLDTDNETSHAFCSPGVLRSNQPSLKDRASFWESEVNNTNDVLDANQIKVNDIAFDLYRINSNDRGVIEASLSKVPSYETSIAQDDEQEEIINGVSQPEQVSEFISYLYGVVFARWDIRFAFNSNLIKMLPKPLDTLPVFPLAVLFGADGLPANKSNIASEAWLKARPDASTLPEMRARGAEQVVVLDGKEFPATIPDSAYPLPIPWDGILVDDPGMDGKSPHPEDLVERARLVLRLLWPENHAAIEAEACEILGVRELRDYFRKPGGFFADHLKRYSKSRRQAPIYWPLSTASGAYTLWLYYPRLSAETLPTALNRFIDPKIAAVSDYAAALEVRLNQISGRVSTDLRDELDRQKAFLAELRDFRAELLRISALPYQPDLNDGVILNAAPFHRLFRLGKWSKDTESAWKKLQGEEYEWSQMAYILWPERVREVCKTDKSIAIAHGLEHLYVETAPKKSKGKRKTDDEIEEMGL
jgi:hypothetical protein